MFTLSKILSLLLSYRYVFIFPLAIIEGPIITIIAGFFVTTHVFNPFIVYGLVVLGDAIGDSFLYWFGRGSRSVVHRFFGKSINKQKLDEAREYFTTHHNKALVMSKIVHGVGISGLVAAGSLHVSYKKFFFTCLAISLIQSAVFLLLGILFGHAYQQLNTYLGYFGIITATVGIALIVFLIIKFKARIR